MDESSLSGNRISLHGGELILHRRQYRNGVWQYQLRLPDGKYERKTTHLSDLDEATRFAEKRRGDVKIRTERGLSVTGTLFEKCCKEFIEFKQREYEEKRKTKSVGLKRTITLINTYIIPHFKGRMISNLTARDIDGYHTWYRDSWNDGSVRVFYRTKSHRGQIVYDPPLRVEVPHRSAKPPKAAARQFAQLILEGIFTLAVRNQHISSAEKPLFQTIANPARRRGAFNQAEQRILLAELEKSIVAAPTPRQETDHLLYLYVRFMLLTGLRPGKEADLRFRDITHEPSHCVVNVRDGKTGPREVMASNELTDVVKAIWHQQPAPAPDQRLWVKSGAEGVNKFIYQFGDLLDRLGMTQDANGNERTLYSLRHTYFTDRLTLLHVPVDKLALNGGTSVAMITKHYSHLEIRNHIQLLAQRLPGS